MWAWPQPGGRGGHCPHGSLREALGPPWCPCRHLKPWCLARHSGMWAHWPLLWLLLHRCGCLVGRWTGRQTNGRAGEAPTTGGGQQVKSPDTGGAQGPQLATPLGFAAQPAGAQSRPGATAGASLPSCAWGPNGTCPGHRHQDSVNAKCPRSGQLSKDESVPSLLESKTSAVNLGNGGLVLLRRVFVAMGLELVQRGGVL